jgi:hypothetical protein
VRSDRTPPIPISASPADCTRSILTTTLTTEIELVSETLDFYLELTRLSTLENCIIFIRRESFKSYTVLIANAFIGALLTDISTDIIYIKLFTEI